MNRVCILAFASLLGCSVFYAGGTAYAATLTSSFSVSATVVATCTGGVSSTWGDSRRVAVNCAQGRANVEGANPMTSPAPSAGATPATRLYDVGGGAVVPTIIY